MLFSERKRNKPNNNKKATLLLFINVAVLYKCFEMGGVY